MDKERIKQNNLETYNRWASRYDKAFLTKHSQKLNDVVFEMLRGRDFASLLDVGCGTGHFLELVATNRQSLVTSHPLKLAGIDMTPGMLDVARQHLGDSADLRLGDVETLPWLDDSFDIVTSTDVFHHLTDLDLALKEIKRVLKPGGVVITTDAWFPAPFRQIVNLILPFVRTGEARVYSRSEMLSPMISNGYRDVSWKRFHILGQTVTGTK